MFFNVLVLNKADSKCNFMFFNVLVLNKADSESIRYNKPSGAVRFSGKMN